MDVNYENIIAVLEELSICENQSSNSTTEPILKCSFI
jgi:hypothetical protein